MTRRALRPIVLSTLLVAGCTAPSTQQPEPDYASIAHREQEIVARLGNDDYRFKAMNVDDAKYLLQFAESPDGTSNIFSLEVAEGPVWRDYGLDGNIDDGWFPSAAGARQYRNRITPEDHRELSDALDVVLRELRR